MANLTISMDDTDKLAIGAFCNATGFTVSSLYNVFTKAVLREHRVPFEIIMSEAPNKETLAAMREAERVANDPRAKGYTDLKALWTDLEK